MLGSEDYSSPVSTECETKYASCDDAGGFECPLHVDRSSPNLARHARCRYADGQQQERPMQKIDLDAMSIDELAKLRDNAGVKLTEKVTARRNELEAELARLSVYGKGGKAAAAAAPKL